MTEQQPLTSEVLNRAADLIQERGWIDGPDGWPGMGEADAPLCLEGGLLAALGMNVTHATIDEQFFLDCPAHAAVMDYLRTDNRWGARAGSLAIGTARAYDWNDVNGRTEAEVIEVLRAAAAIEQAREADHTLTIEPLDADGRGTGECELTAQGVA